MKKKIIRAATVAGSLRLLKGQLRFLSDHYEVVAIGSGVEQLKQVEEEEGVCTVEVPMERKISLWKDVRSLLRLVRLFREERPHIVHSMTPKAGLLCMIAARITGVPIRVHTFTGLLFPTATGIKRRILIATDRITCWCATHIIPEGEGVKKDLIVYGITRKPIAVVGNGNVNGIDLAFFDPQLYTPDFISAQRASIGLTDDDFVFIFVGRLVKDKGLNELIAAFRKIENPHAKLLLVGRYEPDLDPLETETMEEIKSNPDIVEVGWQTDVRPWLALSHTFILPSYREGFPNVVLQAGAMGLPSIVTDINGSNEIIIDGENGLIIPGRDETALLQAMNKVLKQKNQYIANREKNRSMIANRFEQKALWKALLSQYQSWE